MKKRYAILLCHLAVVLSVAQAQRPEKMDFHLRSFLAKPHPADRMVDLFIHGERESVGLAVRAVGGHVKLALSQLVSARVPASRVAELSSSPAVRRFEFSLEEGELLNDSMRVKTRVNLVQQGAAPLTQSYDGTGVIMGFIDSGLDLNHPDFRDENGNTRVIRYWDQVPAPSGTSPLPFGYGREWTQQQLDAGGAIPVDPPNQNGHGTTVVGTGAGNGLANGRHKGVAPGADIVIVASALGSANWRATVADGVAYILAVAEAQGKPAVINASLGSYLGSHDGKDAAALIIDALLEEEGGRVMVAAAGNSQTFAPYHMQTTVAPTDTAFTWFQYNANSGLGFGAVFFEVWADDEDFEGVQFAIGADRVASPYLFRGNTPFRSVSELVGQTVVDTLRSYAGNRLGVVQYYAAPRGDQYQLQVLLQQPDSFNNHFRFMTTGTGKFDVWSGAAFGTSNMVADAPDITLVADADSYVVPDRNKHMVDSWACLSNVLTVANYYNKVTYTDWAGNPQVIGGTEEAISVNSSAGPTRDERMKPDVAAPGDVTFTAGPLDVVQWIIDNQNGWKVDPGGMHMRAGGTSMASPVVAGAAALYLQRCPGATTQEVIAAIHRSAVSDQFTGSVPNNRWGMGKLDAFRMMRNNASLVAESNTFCDGQSVQVSLPADFVTAEWNTGTTSEMFLVTAAGEISALMTSASGCTAQSDTLEFFTLPAPEAPLITQDGTLLTSSTAIAYQWYFNGNAIEGANGQAWNAVSTGDYTVEGIAANGCSTFSTPVNVLTVGVAEEFADGFALWPNPVKGEVNLVVPHAMLDALVTVMTADGKVVFTLNSGSDSQLVINVDDLAAGAYVMLVASGAEQWSTRFVKLP